MIPGPSSKVLTKITSAAGTAGGNNDNDNEIPDILVVNVKDDETTANFKLPVMHN